jgi:hypothetical protein
MSLPFEIVNKILLYNSTPHSKIIKMLKLKHNSYLKFQEFFLTKDEISFAKYTNLLIKHNKNKVEKYLSVC